jgi:SAM-dependent methyltransferase
VLVLDTATDPASTADRLIDFINAHDTEPPMPDEPDDIRKRLLSASGTFRKKDGRHELRTKDVMYCAFSTPRFTITPEESQRDATKRVATFGLTAEDVAGRTILDLGSNAGAMLFELSNFAPAAAYGIEYDADKVDLANEIAEVAAIENVRFAQGDIDELDPAEVGVHDIVLALAIEAHVQQPDRLYQLLGRVTGDLLCFEGNSTCDMDAVRARLTEAGFGDFVDLGFCQDDRDPRNNTRPQMLARKLKPKRGLLGRLRRR